MPITSYRSPTNYRLSEEDLQAAAIKYAPRAPVGGSTNLDANTFAPPTKLPYVPKPPEVTPLGPSEAPPPLPPPPGPATPPVVEPLPVAPPVNEAAPPVAPIEGVEGTTQLRNLTDAELSTLIDLIASRYNLTREQLVAQENSLGHAARQLEEQLARLRRDSVRGAENTASERGLLRSGIHARNIANIDTAIAQQASQGTLQRQASESDIAAARAALEANLAADQATARAASAAGTLQFEQGQTVQDLLASLPLAPNQLPPPLMPANPYIGNPFLPTAPSMASLFGNSGFTPQMMQAFYDNYFSQGTAGAAGGNGGGALHY